MIEKGLPLIRDVLCANCAITIYSISCFEHSESKSLKQDL